MRQTASSVALTVLGVFAATSPSFGAKPGSGGTPTVVDPPCNMADFVGDAAYPAGLGAFIAIIYPHTGDVVSGTVDTQLNSFAGRWEGETYPGSVLESQLFADGKLVDYQDYSARKWTPLTWSVGRGATSGPHQLVARLFVTNWDRTKICYVDSPPVYPVAR